MSNLDLFLPSKGSMIIGGMVSTTTENVHTLIFQNECKSWDPMEGKTQIINPTTFFVCLTLLLIRLINIV